MSAAYFDLGGNVPDRPTQPPEPRITQAEQDAIERQARATVEGEAKHVRWWVGAFDDANVKLDVEALGRELHRAWQGGTTYHCLRDVAQDHVERMVEEEMREIQEVGR